MTGASLVMVIIVSLLIAALVVGLLASEARRRLIWQIIAMTLAETDWQSVQQWEIRAMAVFCYNRLPRRQQWCLGSCADLEDAVVEEWCRAVLWYAKENPREDAELFGDVGPW